ncbi:MAG: AsmA family protein [Bacteroidales bacterium]|nr:AsmA family protein [Bacteroidales bacterium]MCF8455765.1 AsmA family protein [Bacteroidales bacterium]
MKGLKISLFVLGGLIGLFLLASIFLAFIYGEEIKKLAINEINKQIETKIEVGDLQFSLLESFPFAQLDFQNVTILTGTSFNKKEFAQYDSDTLLKAERVSLSFNLKELLRNKLNLRKIDIEKGKLNLLVDSQGKVNYRFWKEDNVAEGSNFSINLKEVLLNNMEFLLVHGGQDMVLHSHLHELDMSGEFSNSDYGLEISSAMWIGKFMVGSNSYLSRRSTNLDVKMDVKDDVYSIRAGNISLNQLAFILSGQVILSEPNSIDLKIKGKKLDVQSFVSLMPEDFSKFTKDIESEGIFSFDTHISGEFTNRMAPLIETSFGIEKGQLKNRKSGLKITHILAKGNFSNGKQKSSKSSLLNIDQLSFKLGDKGSFSGKGSITNFIHPKIKLTADINADLSGLADFFTFESIENISGQLVGDISLNGDLPEGFRDSPAKLKGMNISGAAKISKLMLKMKDNPNGVEDFTGQLILSNSKAEIKEASLIYGKTQLNISASFPFPLEQLFAKEKKINVGGIIHSPKINLDNLLSAKSSSDDTFNFPANYDLNFKLTCDSFLYDRFTARNLSSTFKMKDGKVQFKDMSMKTLNGSLSGNMNLEESPQKNLHIFGDADLSEIDLHELLFTFRNFGQDFFTMDHVIGDISGKVMYDTEWSQKFDLIDKSLLIESSVEVKNGELFDFEPMLALSDYIMVDDLRHIKFSTLKNDIVIQGEKVYIPRMDIHSSAINVEISGIHGFDQQVSYDVKVLLSDLLTKKISQKKQEEWQIEDDPDGMITLFLILEGNVDDIQIKYDFKRAKSALKDDIQNEKQEMKTILREELGLFKKDSTLSKKPKEKKKKVKVVWDEE